MAIVLELQLGASNATLTGEPRNEGNGKLYELERDDDRVAKLLKPLLGSPPSSKVSQKLDTLLVARGTLTDELSQRPRVAWPDDLLLDGDDRARGYVMKRLGRSKIGQRVDALFDHVVREAELTDVDYGFLLKIARNLAETVAAAEGGIAKDASGEARLALVFADLREEKLWIHDDGFVTVTDADAVQLEDRDTHAKHQASPPQLDRSPPNTQSILDQQGFFDSGHDPFALAITLFRILMERAHPFGPGAQAIARGESAYFRYRPQSEDQFQAPRLKLADDQLRLEDLDPRLGQLFKRCFETGLFAPDDRPSAKQWVDALAAVKLRTCSDNPRHKYFDHLNHCPWHRLLDKTGIDPFPHVVDPPSLTALEPEELPAEGGPLVIRGKNLSGVTRVLFGTRAVEDLQSTRPEKLQLVAPAGKGSVDVSVAAGPRRSAPLPLKYRPRLEAPVLKSIEPPSLPLSGGPALLLGQHLENTEEVLLGGRSALFEQLSSEKLRVEAPAGKGPVDVRVRTAAGTSNAVTVSYRAAHDPVRIVLTALLAVCAIGLVAWLVAERNAGGGGDDGGSVGGGGTSSSGQTQTAKEPRNPECRIDPILDTKQYVDKSGTCGTFYQLASIHYGNEGDRATKADALRAALTTHWKKLSLGQDCPPIEARVFESATTPNTLGMGMFVLKPLRTEVAPDLNPKKDAGPPRMEPYSACITSTRP